MRELRNEFMELDGRRVKIVKNLKVNVLEKSQELLANNVNKYKVCPKPTNSPVNIFSDDHDNEFVIKPVRVDIKALDKKVTEVGVFYGSCLLVPTQATEVMGPCYEVDIVNIDTEETESEVIINIDDSCDSEAVSESLEIQKLDEGSINKSNGSSDLEENTALVDCGVVELRKLLKESEEKLKNRKMKITNLKISLANLERKNAEKKLSIQKRDMKIRELEGMVKIQDHKLLVRNIFISRLQNENDLLSKFKASLKPVGKVPGVMKGISTFSEAKNTTATEEVEDVEDVSRNICEDVEMGKNISDDICGEIESISEFLHMVAQVKNVPGDVGNSHQVMSDASKNNESNDIVEIGNDDIIEVNGRAPNNTITTISSDEEIHLVNEGEDDNILIPTLDHYPALPLKGVPTIQEEIVDPFLRLQPFASLCAKSSNIVVRESKNRKKPPSTTLTERFQRKPKQAKLGSFFH